MAGKPPTFGIRIVAVDPKLANRVFNPKTGKFETTTVQKKKTSVIVLKETQPEPEEAPLPKKTKEKVTQPLVSVIRLPPAAPAAPAAPAVPVPPAPRPSQPIRITQPPPRQPPQQPPPPPDPSTCKLNQLSCLVWEPLPYPRWPGPIHPHRFLKVTPFQKTEMDRFSRADCGAGRRATDCGFLSLAAALAPLWTKPEQQNRTLEYQALYLRQLLWKSISSNADDLNQFTAYYRQPLVRSDTEYKEEEIGLRRWTAENAREIQLYIEGVSERPNSASWVSGQGYTKNNQVRYRNRLYRAEQEIEPGSAVSQQPPSTTPSYVWLLIPDYNRKFQADEYALRWLTRSAFFQTRKIRIWAMTIPDIGTIEFKLLITPLDEFDPIFDEQEISTEYQNVMRYVMLHHRGNHWQMVGKNPASTAAATKNPHQTILRYPDLPLWIRNTVAFQQSSTSIERSPSIKNQFDCYPSTIPKYQTEPDLLQWSKLSTDTDLVHALQQSSNLRIDDLYLREIKRLCIAPTATTSTSNDVDETLLFGSLLFRVWDDKVLSGILRKRLVQLINISNSRDDDVLNEQLVSVSANWCMPDGRYAEWQSEMKSYEKLWATWRSRLKWQMLFHQPTFRIFLATRHIFPLPNDIETVAPYRSDIVYDRGAWVYLTDADDVDRRLFFQAMSGTGTQGKTRVPLTTARGGWKNVQEQWLLVAASIRDPITGQVRIFSFEQAWLLYSQLQPRSDQSRDIAAFPTQLDEKDKLEFPLPVSKQFFWNWSKTVWERWRTQVIQVALQGTLLSTATTASIGLPLPSSPDQYPNDVRKQFIQQVMTDAIRYDDSPFFLGGPWAVNHRYAVIVDDLRQRISQVVSNQPSLALRLMQTRECWPVDPTEYQKSGIPALLANNVETAPIADVAKEIIRKIRDGAFRLSSQLGLVLAINVMNYASSERIVRHIIILNDQPEVEEEKKTSDFQMLHIVQETGDPQSPTFEKNLERHQFAIWIRLRRRKTNDIHWYMCGSPQKILPCRRWIRLVELPAWFIHSIFTPTQLLQSSQIS